jgi:GAF domain-containing protein
MWLHLLQGRHAQVLANLRLQAYADQQEAHAAYRTRLAGVSVRLQRCGSLAELAQVFLHEVRDMLGAMQGVLYVSDPAYPQRLQLAGSAACAEEPAQTLALGEGLLGQCALERKGQVIDRPPNAFGKVRSALGSSEAAFLVITPLMVQDSLVGVLELALLKKVDGAHQDQLEELVSLLANSVEILRRNLQLQQSAQGAATSSGSSP